MRDFAHSDDPAVQKQLDRLGALTVPQGRLGLETIHALLARLGDPHKQLPPVFHVAGTNGKGSVCAFLRAMLEADGRRVHVTTSPHLVRYNERIRLAGELISDAALAALLEEVLDAGEELAPSFFEVTIAAAFLAFSRVEADACVVEVGLGGRFDATNVLGPDVLAACGIAALGVDHERFLLAPEDGVPQEPLARIAFEKAGIAKPGVPLIAQDYPMSASKAVIDQAMRAGAKPALKGLDWHNEPSREGIAYSDPFGSLNLPLPTLPGAHQADNAALAVAMLRHQDRVQVSEAAMAEGVRTARWPARMQRLSAGPLTEGIAAPIILDGAHNANAAQAVSDALGDGPFVLIAGILKNRDPAAIFGPLKGKVTRFAGVPVLGHEDHDPKDLCHLANSTFALSGSYPAGDIVQAFDWLRSHPPAPGETVLIMGSLYLAGKVLSANREFPD